jgi:hypothetical protein
MIAKACFLKNITESLIFKKNSIKKYVILFNNHAKTKDSMNPVKIS